MKVLNLLSDVGIFIPSYQRPGRQLTFERLPSELKRIARIVVSTGDPYLKKYQKNFIKNIVTCPLKGIGATRQWILEQCFDNGFCKFAFMFDDDMKFGVRDSSMSIKDCSGKDILDMVLLLRSWLEAGFVHVGVSQRFGNNRILDSFSEITRMNNAYAFRVREIISLGRKHGIGFNELEKKYNKGKPLVMEDFHMTLRLLRLGYKNRVTYTYCWSQEKSGDVGGCSTYRDDELQKRSANFLKKEHPLFVTVLEKESKEIWGGFKFKIRTDVNISWKKSFGVDKRKKITSFF